MDIIPYGRQDINQNDIDAIVEVLRSEFLTQGPAVPNFESSVANYCGSKHAVAVNSATSALHIACLALGVGKGDIVWTTPITFVASANCALYCGASIDFVDIDSSSYNMSINSLEEKLSIGRKNKNLPKVVIVVHMCGNPCEMERVYLLSQKYGFKIIEDASHAIGAKYKEEYIGNCRYSDVTIFSFHPVKIITTAEGGMALTNSDHIAKRMQLLRSHGITRNENEMTHDSDGSWYYQQIELGYNYRMTDLQAALGLSQMQRIDKFVDKRQIIAGRYNELLADLPLKIQCQLKDCYSAFHLYVIRLNLLQIDKTHRQVFEELKNMGIGINLHYIPVYHHPYYNNLGFKEGYCKEAELYYQQAISLPIYPTLINADHDKVVTSLYKVLT